MRMYDLAGADERQRFSPYCWREKMLGLFDGLGAKAVRSAVATPS